MAGCWLRGLIPETVRQLCNAHWAVLRQLRADGAVLTVITVKGTVTAQWDSVACGLTVVLRHNP